ncbi:Magnesium protoporphyrin IX methyltransferase chloroplastic [Bienertia sinuspersici]
MGKLLAPWVSDIQQYNGRTWWLIGSTDKEVGTQIAKQELQIGDSALSSNLVMPKFEVKDLESLDGKYDTIVCLDVLIHYPQSRADAMIGHLASLPWTMVEKKGNQFLVNGRPFYFNGFNTY